MVDLVGTPGTALSRVGERFSVRMIREEVNRYFPSGAYLFLIGDDYPYVKWRGDSRWFDKRDFSFIALRENARPDDE